MWGLLGAFAVTLLFVTFGVMCLLIGGRALIKREVILGKGKTWSGWTTLLLGIPLSLIGVAFLVSLVQAVLPVLLNQLHSGG